MHMEKRISQIDSWISNYTSEDFIHDEKNKLAVYKAFQEAVESAMDIIVMICKDIGIPPRDDYTNIASIGEEEIIEDVLMESLIKVNSLRNRLVYHHNKLSDKMAFESIKKLLDSLIRFIEMVENWIMRELEI